MSTLVAMATFEFSMIFVDIMDTVTQLERTCNEIFERLPRMEETQHSLEDSVTAIRESQKVAEGTLNSIDVAQRETELMVAKLLKIFKQQFEVEDFGEVKQASPLESKQNLLTLNDHLFSDMPFAALVERYLRQTQRRGDLKFTFKGMILNSVLFH